MLLLLLLALFHRLGSFLVPEEPPGQESQIRFSSSPGDYIWVPAFVLSSAYFYHLASSKDLEKVGSNYFLKNGFSVCQENLLILQSAFLALQFDVVFLLGVCRT